MYKMMIDVSGTERVFLFRGPGCRRKMIRWLDDYLGRAAAEDIRAIRVWGTVGNKSEIVYEFGPPRRRAASLMDTGTATVTPVAVDPGDW